MPLVPLAPIAGAPRTNGARVLPTAELQAGNARQGMQMAQALGQVGETLAGLQAKYAEITDARSMIEAENVMRKTTQDFNTWRMSAENADESQWLPKWQEMQGAAQKQIDGLKMTEGARLNTTRSWGRWSDAQTISVQGDVFKQGVRRTNAALDLRVKQGIDAGDDGLVSSSYAEKAKLGIMTPEEAELEKYDALKRSKATRVGQFSTQFDTLLSDPAATWEDVRSFVEQNPDITDSEKANALVKAENRFALNELDHLVLENPEHGMEAAQNDFKRGRISVNTLDDLTRKAETIKTQQRGNQYAQVVDAIKAGAKPEQVVKLIDERPRLTPGDKAEIMAVLDKPANDPLVLSTLAKEAANFKHSPDSPEYFLFTQRVDALATGDSRSHILGLRDKALGNDKDGSFTRSFGKVFAFADDDLKNGVFGPTTGKLSDLNTVLPPKVRAEVDTLKTKFLNENAERIKKEPAFANYAESKAREAWWNNQNEDDRGESYQAFEIEDATKTRQASSVQVQAIQELEAYRTAHPEKSAAELVQQYDIITSRLRADKKLPPVAPRGGVNPVGSTLPNLNERANSILSR